MKDREFGIFEGLAGRTRVREEDGDGCHAAKS